MSVPGTSPEPGSPHALLADIRHGIGLIEKVVTDPRHPGAMQALDDGSIREGAIGGGFREHLRSQGIVVPNELAVNLGVLPASAADSASVYDTYCYSHWSVDTHGAVHHWEIGVHHDSSGWHWGC